MHDIRTHARIHLHRCFAPLAVWTYGDLTLWSDSSTIAIPDPVLLTPAQAARV